MSEKLSTHKKEVPRDPYTERLLAVCYELVKRQALRSKSEFAKAIGFKYLSQYNEVENRYANFPPKHTATAEAQLLSKWGVNPNYLQGQEKEMFIREPERKKMAVGEDAVKLNFRDKKEKQQLLEELKAKDERIAELEAQLNAQKAPKTDNKPDKPKKK